MASKINLDSGHAGQFTAQVTASSKALLIHRHAGSSMASGNPEPHAALELNCGYTVACCTPQEKAGRQKRPIQWRPVQPRPFSMYFIRSLRCRQDSGNAPLPRVSKILKYLGRSIAHWRYQAQWLEFLHGGARMVPIAVDDPRLNERAHHPYISRMLPRPRRFAILQSHYQQVLTRWPAPVIDRLYSGQPVALGTLVLKDRSTAELSLSRPLGRSREGEMALYLHNAEGLALSSVIFTLADDGDTLLIGCLQGAAAGLGRKAISIFTRQAHGLRPKNLLLSAIYTLGTLTGASQILAVGNAAHPFANRPGKIKSDYDSFWLECGGELGEQGFYRLPEREAQRSQLEVPSKHRAAFRRREALRAEACDMLSQALDPSGAVLQRAA